MQAGDFTSLSNDAGLGGKRLDARIQARNFARSRVFVQNTTGNATLKLGLSGAERISRGIGIA